MFFFSKIYDFPFAVKIIVEFQFHYNKVVALITFSGSGIHFHFL